MNAELKRLEAQKKDTEKSLRFYRDVLGLGVAGESVNYGIEQERLNHVFGSRVRITGLRAPGGPGIEFLEYVVPRGGRPYPEDASPNNILHCQTILRIQDPAQFFDQLAAKYPQLISTELVNIESLQLGGRRAMLVRDPDAHALELVVEA